MMICVGKESDGSYSVRDGRTLLKAGFIKAREAMRWADANGYQTDEEGEDHVGLNSRDAVLGWAFTHGPTREAYRRSTGEDVAPALDRYREWVEENIVGSE